MKRWPLNKAYFWETTPFFRILLPFVAGIMCYAYTQLPAANGVYCVSIICIMFLLYAAIIYAKKSTDFYSVVIFSVVNIMLFVGGISVSYFNDIRNSKAWFGNGVHTGYSYLARITDAPAEKEKSWKLTVAMINSIKDGKVSAVKGTAYLYLYKDRQPMLLHKGDSVLLPDKWQPMHNAGNPFEFDYATYCRRNNILYQQTCSVNDVRLYSGNDADAAPIIERSHDWCMQQLDKYLADSKTKGLIQAMLLGDEVNLDEGLLQSYSETGIVHIIAISGGNVAIFFLVITFLLWWLKNKKHLWIKYAIALPLIWFYVVMAGAPPSAVRAALMFSLFSFSVILQKNNSSLNTLFAAAFLLLCSEPMWLFSVGFQLSFVAVLSLILFYTPVYKWLSPVHKITRWLWGTIAASIAAEILVAPLVIYYFHTFPLLFIVANVAAFLFMEVVLVLGMMMVVLSPFAFIAKWIGIVTVFLVTVFDKIVIWLQGFNPASFHFLMITGVELLLIYIAISCILWFLMKRQKAALFIGIATCCVLFLCFCNDEWNRLHQQHLVVYNTGKANHIELIKGTTFSVLREDTSAVKKINYATKPAHINWRAWRNDSVAANEIFDVGGKTVLLLNEDIYSDSHFPVDYLIINYTGKSDAMKLKKIFSPGMIVIGNNYSKKQQEKFTKESSMAGLQTHSIGNDGAFILH